MNLIVRVAREREARERAAERLDLIRIVRGTTATVEELERELVDELNRDGH